MPSIRNLFCEDVRAVGSRVRGSQRVALPRTVDWVDKAEFGSQPCWWSVGEWWASGGWLRVLGVTAGRRQRSVLPVVLSKLCGCGWRSTRHCHFNRQAQQKRGR